MYVTNHHKTRSVDESMKIYFMVLMHRIISSEQFGVGFMFLALIEPKLSYVFDKPS